MSSLSSLNPQSSMVGQSGIWRKQHHFKFKLTPLQQHNTENYLYAAHESGKIKVHNTGLCALTHTTIITILKSYSTQCGHQNALFFAIWTPSIVLT